MNLGTHCYVGSMACGCGVALVRDMPEYPKDTAADVAGLIRSGYTVQRLPHEEACEAFQVKCANYPHTDWQRRNEMAKAGRGIQGQLL